MQKADFVFSLILQLGSIGVWTRVCHRQNASALMDQIWLELVLERFAPNRFAAVARVGRITALDLSKNEIFRSLCEIKKKINKKNKKIKKRCAKIKF